MSHSPNEFMGAYLNYLLSRPADNKCVVNDTPQKLIQTKKKPIVNELYESETKKTPQKVIPTKSKRKKKNVKVYKNAKLDKNVPETIVDYNTSVDINDEPPRQEDETINNVEAEPAISILDSNQVPLLLKDEHENNNVQAVPAVPILQYQIHPGLSQSVVMATQTYQQYQIYQVYGDSTTPTNSNQLIYVYPDYNYNGEAIATELLPNLDVFTTTPVNPACNNEVSTKKGPQKTISKPKKPAKPRKRKPKKNNTCEIVFDNDLSIDIKDEPLRLDDDDIEDKSVSADLAPIKDEDYDETSCIPVGMDASLLDEQTREKIFPQIKDNNFESKWPSNLWNRGKYNEIFCANPKTSDEVFFEHCRIFRHQFDTLYNLVNAQLWAQNSKTVNKKYFVHPHVELALTITFLTRGHNLSRLSRDYCIHQRAIAAIIPKVCQILSSALEPLYLGHQGLDNWLKIADDFWEKTRFPHTVGCVNAKLFSGVLSKNSVIFLACCDAKNNFLWAILDYSKGYKLSDSPFFKSLSSTLSSLPQTSANSGLNMPHFFVGGDQMPLLKAIMTPYKETNLSQQEENFNQLLSGVVTDTIDKTFDILANRFWLYKQNYTCSTQTVLTAMKASISLYNFLKQTGEDIPCPPKVDSKLAVVSLNCDQLISNHASAVSSRNMLTDYLSRPAQAEEIILIEEDDAEMDVILIE